eukprot:1723965-Amphidinium_carterae.1
MATERHEGPVSQCLVSILAPLFSNKSATLDAENTMRLMNRLLPMLANVHTNSMVVASKTLETLSALAPSASNSNVGLPCACGFRSRVVLGE